MRAYALRFYRRCGVADPEQAYLAALAAVETFLDDLDAWQVDMPEPQARGKGRPQPHPSQRRLHVIAELEQLSDLIDANRDRGEHERWSITALRGRKRLSRYSLDALLTDQLSGSGTLKPFPGPAVQDADMNDVSLWGFEDHRTDVRSMKRRFAEASRRKWAILFVAMRDVRALPGAIRDLLQGLVRDANGHARVSDVLAFPRALLREGLAERVRDVARHARILFHVRDNQRAKERERRLIASRQPAPLYRLVQELIGIAAPWPDHPDDRQRLLVRPDAKILELSFAIFVSHAVTYARQAAERHRPDLSFDPFMGIVASGIVKHRGAMAFHHNRDRKIERVAITVLHHREQAIVLRAHLKTIERWAYELRDLINLDQIDLWRNFYTYGYYGILDWAREAEARYAEGVFYVDDIIWREGGRPGRMKTLSVTMLRQPDPVDTSNRAVMSPRAVEAVRTLFEIWYDEEPQMRAQLSAALNLLPAE